MLPALAVTNSSPNPLWKKTASTSRFALCAIRSTPVLKKSSTLPVAWINSTTNSATCSNANRRFVTKKTAIRSLFCFHALKTVNLELNDILRSVTNNGLYADMLPSSRMGKMIYLNYLLSICPSYADDVFVQHIFTICKKVMQNTCI